MKQKLAVLLSLVMTISLTACSSAGTYSKSSTFASDDVSMILPLLRDTQKTHIPRNPINMTLSQAKSARKMTSLNER